MVAEGDAMNEADLLVAAKDGDQAAFGRLVEPYQHELHVHAYRMLGSGADAEDALQDAMLDAWKGLARFEGRSSLRSWLYTVTTNASLKVIRRRPKRVLPIDYGPPADPHDFRGEPVTEVAWLEPYPDEQLRYEQRETVELAFVAALQHLPARQRAVLILRDVLGFSARETGKILDTSAASIDSALQRAHKAVDGRLPEQSQQATLRSLDDGRIRELVDGYVHAWMSDDVDALVALLSEEAAFAMPPQHQWFSGREAVAAFLATHPFKEPVRRRMHPIRANGQLAFADYIWDDASQAYRPHAIHVVELEGERIKGITAFRTPALFVRFGLPEAIDYSKCSRARSPRSHRGCSTGPRVNPDWHPGGFGDTVGSDAALADGDLLLIDPLLPADDRAAVLEALEQCLPDRVVTIHGPPRAGARLPARARKAFRDLVTGELGPAGVRAFRIGRPVRGERPLWLPAHRALAFGDSLVTSPDGDLRMWIQEPLTEARYAFYRARFAPTLQLLLEQPVERILVTHGQPVTDRAVEALRDAISSPPWYHHG